MFPSRKARLTVMVIALIVALTVLAGCTGGGAKAGGALEAIKGRGVLRVGVKNDVPGFGYLNPDTNEFEGFEIDLARLIAKELIGSENVEFTAVTAKTRQALLDNDELDMVIATFTVTEERKKQMNFSPTYYTDGIKLLVKKSSGITGLADLDGKTIGVAQGATTPERLGAKAEEIGVNVSFAEFPDYPSIFAALQADRVQAFSVDGAILRGYEMQDPDNMVILPDLYSEEPYGIASKKENTDLADAIAKIINDLQSSGELNQMLAKWGLGGQ